VSKLKDLLNSVEEDMTANVNRYLATIPDSENVAKKLDGIINAISKIANSDPKKMDDKQFREFKRAVDDLKNFRFRLGKGKF
jgi:hypothetical protein